MEPSGQMDNSRLHLYGDFPADRKGDSIACGQPSYQLYDLADEEVHFTRNPLPGSAIPFALSRHNSIVTQSPLGFKDSSSQQQQQEQQFYHQHDPSIAITPEQVRSSKLLNTIGSKLRRGSNYLMAPKLVGQYLLGITIRSWSEFLNTSRMLKAPSNTQQLTRRLLSNLSHFQGNYLCVSLILVVYCILTSPLLLLAIVAYISTLYFVTARSAIGRPFQILTFKPNLQQQYSFLTLISLPLLWVAGAPSAIFWIIGASFVVVGLHASMYNGEKAFQELPDHADHQVATSSYNNLTGGPVGNGHLGVSFRNSQVPYYAYYPSLTQSASNSQSYQYVSLPSTPAREATGGSGQRGSVSSTISQWMPFGGRQNASSSGGGGEGQASSPKASQRVPEVNIISQDFAGLGRVYEV